jgi:hypothetical protein
MATAFSEVLAPGELSVTYTTTHAPFAAQSLCVRPRLAAHGRVHGRRENPEVLSFCQVLSEQKDST